MDQILKTLEDDATLTPAQLAVMFDKEEGDIRALIKEYEAEGVILGYKTIIDWDKTEREYVTAMIEVKTTPQRDRGFDRIAEKIYNYPEVQSVYLMSGGYDLCVIIEGHEGGRLLRGAEAGTHRVRDIHRNALRPAQV